MPSPRRQLATLLTCALALACSTNTREVGIECDGPHPAPEDSLPTSISGPDWQGVIFDAARGEQARWFLARPEQCTWSPNEDDVRAFESALAAELRRAMTSPASVDPYAKDRPEYQAYLAGEIRKVLDQLPHYRRQYVGLLSADGRKTLFVNAFPGARWPLGRSFDFGRWREELVVVSDGGFWYWHAEYDPQIGRLLRFDSNGEA